MDLRHRLPSIWTAAHTGRVPAHQARHIATATRHLSFQQAGVVDEQIAPALGAVSYGRLENLLDAAIIDADPDGAAQRAAPAAQERFVRLGRKSEHGLKLIIARASAGDAIYFKAIIDRLADILAQQGDLDTVEVRRSKAIGILAQPAEALRLLYAHQDDDWDGPTEPDDPDREEPTDDEPDVDQTADHADPPPDKNDADTSVGPKQTDTDPATTGLGDEPHASTEPTSEPTTTGKEKHRSLQLLPPPFDPKRARPRAVIYVHLSHEALTAGRGVARVEQVGPILLNRLHTLLGDHCTINLKPVIDLPAGHTPIDSYEIPANLREHILLRHPADVFPYAAATSGRIDLDHTIPYQNPEDGGPPGQTRIGNLGPHTRLHHRLKTHGHWQVRQPEPGTWLWRSPHHRIYLTNNTGTHNIGNTEFAHAIWHAAANPVPDVRPLSPVGR